MNGKNLMISNNLDTQDPQTPFKINIQLFAEGDGAGFDGGGQADSVPAPANDTLVGAGDTSQSTQPQNLGDRVLSFFNGQGGQSSGQTGNQEGMSQQQQQDQSNFQTQQNREGFNANQQQNQDVNTQQTQPNEGQGQGVDPTIQSLQQAGLPQFKSLDDFANSYKEMQRVFHQTRQEMANMRQQLESGQQRQPNVQGNNNMPEQQAQQQAQEIFSPEEIESLNAELSEKLFENPYEGISKVAQKLVQAELQKQLSAFEQKVNPALEHVEKQTQQESWNNAATEFASQHPDISQYQEQMMQYLEVHPELFDNPQRALEEAYNVASGRYSKPPQVDYNQLMQDENFVNQYILNNQDLVKKVVGQHMQQVNQANTAPNMIGSSNAQGGQSIGTPQRRPTSFEEAGEMFKKQQGWT